MRLLYAYGFTFKKDNDENYYSDGAVTEEMWRRYTNISDQLTIIAYIDNIVYDKDYAEMMFNTISTNDKKLTQVPKLTNNLKSFVSLSLRRKFNNIINDSVTNCDCIIARVPSTVGNKAIKYAKKYHKPYLVEVVGCSWDALWNHSLKGKILAPFNFFMQKRVVKDAPYVLYVTNEFLQHRYPCKKITIGCSDVELQKTDIDVIMTRINRIKQLRSRKSIVIGTTAAVNVHYKGQMYVIEAISKLNKQGYNFEYHLAGGGDNSFLMALAEKFNVADKVKFLGSLPHDEVFSYLDNLDIYIQPSKQEGLPRALVEAMSRGCPSLGSNAGGIPELIDKKFVFNKGSVEEICNLLKMMDENRMIEEAKRNYDKAKEYDKELLLKKRNNFYHRFILEVKR